jgi:hypothetical protein
VIERRQRLDVPIGVKRGVAIAWSVASAYNRPELAVPEAIEPSNVSGGSATGHAVETGDMSVLTIRMIWNVIPAASR